MSSQTFAPLDITPMWSRVNDELIELVDLVPDDKLDSSPKPELWNFKGILLHVCLGRHLMMEFVVKDGEQSPNVLVEGQTKEGLKEQLPRSWTRMEGFLSDAGLLAREYEALILGESGLLTGHALAFGQREHDIHHRADILHYMRELGLAHEEPDTLARVMRERRGSA